MSREKTTFISVLAIVCLSWQISHVNGGNILGLFTSHSPSHLIVHMSIAKVLAEQGHNVTVVVSNEPKVNHKNINVILIPPSDEQNKMLKQELGGMASRKHNIFTTIKNFFGPMKMLIDLQAEMLQDSRFTVLYDNPDTKFDLVIHGFFMNTFQIGVAAKFRAPLIESWTASPMLFTDIMLGNPSESSYVPDMNLSVGVGEKMNFLQRLQNFLSSVFFRIIKSLLDIRMRTFYKELFPNDGSFPSLRDMEKNVSLVFCNSHVTEGPVRPNVPAVIEIGGIQVKDTPDPLPENEKMSSAKITFICVLVIVCLSWQTPQVRGANILGLFTSHSPSHLIVHMSVAKVLAEQGHNVTVVVSQVPKVKHEKIKIILIPPTPEQEKSLSEEVSGMATKKFNLLTIVKNFFGSLKLLIDMQADILKDPRFTVLYDNPDTKFDVVLQGYFMNSFQFGVAAKLNAPLVVNWMGPSMLFTDNLVGNPSETSYVPGMNTAVETGKKMNFLQRLQNLLSSIFFGVFKEILDFRMRSIYKDLFANDEHFPSLQDMEKNVSLLFCNSHFSEGPIRPNVPAIVEIGGIQVKPTPDLLPNDIRKFLDSANETGAILFSLGSNLQGSSIKPETATYIYNVLSKLKEKVIWKWEDPKNTPGKSANILYKKWMPQDDILAHPNIKMFITHAGKGGIAEAQYHGVPMVALPVFADQHGNAMKMVAAGYGQQLELLTLSEDALRVAVVDVLNNPQYQKNVQQFSKLYRDRPMTARQSVAYWTDYVIRHHGAPHMQSPLVHMSFIEYMNLDVYLLILMVFYVLYRIFKLVLMFVCSKLSKKSKKNKKKVKSQ